MAKCSVRHNSGVPKKRALFVFRGGLWGLIVAGNSVEVHFPLMLFTGGVRGRTKLTAKACVHLLKAPRLPGPPLGGMGGRSRGAVPGIHRIRRPLHPPGRRLVPAR